MITKEEIENIAMLAKLSVKEEEFSALLAQLQQMTEFADVVRCADISGIEEDTQSIAGSFVREDRVEPSFDRGQILSNAPAGDGEFFLVGKRA